MFAMGKNWKIPLVLGALVLLLGLFDTLWMLNPGHQYDIEHTRSQLIAFGKQGREFGPNTLANAPEPLVRDLRQLGASEGKCLAFAGWERSRDPAHPPDTHFFRWSSRDAELILTASRSRQSTGYDYLSHEVRKIE